MALHLVNFSITLSYITAHLRENPTRLKRSIDCASYMDPELAMHDFAQKRRFQRIHQSYILNTTMKGKYD